MCPIPATCAASSPEASGKRTDNYAPGWATANGDAGDPQIGNPFNAQRQAGRLLGIPFKTISQNQPAAARAFDFKSLPASRRDGLSIRIC